MPSVQLREREAEREAKSKALHSVLEEGRTDPAGNLASRDGPADALHHGAHRAREALEKGDLLRWARARAILLGASCALRAGERRREGRW